VAINFITWLWGDKYSSLDVAKLRDGVKRNSKQSHRFIVVTNEDLDLPSDVEVVPIEDENLIGRGCFCRLRMFDPAWQKKHNLTDRIVTLDLDLVVTGKIDPLFDRPEGYLILQGVNAVNPNPFNCSLTMLRPGLHREIWDRFSLEESEKMKYHEFPDDQGWIWHTFPRARGWVAGSSSGIYGYKKPGWPVAMDHRLPHGARIVAFIGARKPQQFAYLGWVQANWRVGT